MLKHDNPRILIIRPDAMGDVTLLLPLIKSIKKTYPNAYVATLQQAYTAPVFEGVSDLDEVIIDWKKSGKAVGLSGLRAYAQFIKEKNFDAVLLPYLNDYFLALAIMAGIPIRVGDGNKLLLRPFLTHKVAQDYKDQIVHEVEYNVRLFSAITPHLKSEYDVCLPVQTEWQDSAQALLNREGWTGAPLIGIHTTTGGGNRPWTAEKYKDLIQLIQDSGSHQVVITGFGEKDAANAAHILHGLSQKPVVVVNKTTISQLKAIIQLCDVFVGTDTGPVHLAGMLRTKVLCVSPTKFVKLLRWGAWSTIQKVVQNAQQCNWVCNPFQCKRPDCLDAIPVSFAYLKLKTLLQKDKMNLEEIRHEWFVSSSVVALGISDMREWPAIYRWYRHLAKLEIPAYLVTSDSRIQSAIESKEGVQIHCFSGLNPFEITQFIASKDITIFHWPGPKRFYWQCLGLIASLKQAFPAKFIWANLPKDVVSKTTNSSTPKKLVPIPQLDPVQFYWKVLKQTKK